MNQEIPLALLLTGLGETTGAALLVWGLSSLRQARDMKAWPRVEGTILTSSYRVEEYAVTDLDNEEVSGALYKPLVTYEYRVNHRLFVGSRLRPSSGDVYTLRDAQLVTEQYPPGKQVEVQHDPADPSFAVLETGTAIGAVLLIVGGLFFLLPSVVAMLLLLL